MPYLISLCLSHHVRVVSLEHQVLASFSWVWSWLLVISVPKRKIILVLERSCSISFFSSQRKTHDQLFCFIGETNVINFFFGRFPIMVNLLKILIRRNLSCQDCFLVFRVLNLCPLSQFLVEVNFIFDGVNLVDKGQLHMVIYVQEFKPLTYLHLEEVICLFKFTDVHILQLNPSLTLRKLTLDIC